MKNYELGSDEVVLFKSNVFLPEDEAGGEILLTNKFFVVLRQIKKPFTKTEIKACVYPLEEVKTYKDKPYIKVNKNQVDLYFAGGEESVVFEKKGDVGKFVTETINAITGKTSLERGVQKIGGAVDSVDNSLGIDTRATVKNVVKKGVGIFLDSKSLVTKAPAEKQIEDAKKPTQPATFDEKVDSLKKLKELLDAGIITQEEFDEKKKEIF